MASELLLLYMVNEIVHQAGPDFNYAVISQQIFSTVLVEKFLFTFCYSFYRRERKWRRKDYLSLSN